MDGMPASLLHTLTPSFTLRLRVLEYLALPKLTCAPKSLASTAVRTLQPSDFHVYNLMARLVCFELLKRMHLPWETLDPMSIRNVLQASPDRRRRIQCPTRSVSRVRSSARVLKEAPLREASLNMGCNATPSHSMLSGHPWGMASLLWKHSPTLSARTLKMSAPSHILNQALITPLGTPMRHARSATWCRDTWSNAFWMSTLMADTGSPRSNALSTLKANV